MNTIAAFPLQWPAGWPRLHAAARLRARFGTRRKHDTQNWQVSARMTVAQAVARVRAALQRLSHTDDIVISTNLELRLDGLPRSSQRAPDDPGAAVYWRDGNGAMRCMAIDRYDSVADNLAAVAATLDAMRSIERHGGAAILDRAFTGFTALPAPDADKPWHVVLGCPAHASTQQAIDAYRRARSRCHPDRGGDAEVFGSIQAAWLAFCEERGLEA